MASVLSFDENEHVLFKHRASMNQLSGPQGDLLITNARLYFQSAGSYQLAWANIKKIKYSPANDPQNRVMLRVDSVSEGGSAIFYFIGPDIEKCKIELARLKLIISQIRNTDSGAPTLGRTSTSSRGDQLSEAKRRLLEADRSLAKQYRDLVENSKLLDDNEFWSSHAAGNLILKGTNENMMAVRSKGKLTSLFADLKKTYTKGKLVLNLTVEHKEHIFRMYPNVRTVFDEKVPLEWSEVEFWTHYFQSEYYARDKGVSSAAGAGFEAKTDDIFARADDVATVAAFSSTTSSSSNKRQKRVSGLVDNSIDLTLTAGDIIAGDHDALSVAVSEGLGGLAGLPHDDAEHVHKAAIVSKYNRHSGLYMEAVNGATAPTYDKSSFTTDLSELRQPAEPAYIPLLFCSENFSSDRGVISRGPRSPGRRDSENKIEATEVSDGSPGAFGIRVTQSACPRLCSSASEQVTEVTAGATGQGLRSVLPSAARAKALFDRETRDLALRRVSRIEVPAASSSSELSQELLEQYDGVFLLLKHFYALLGRSGSDAPRVGTAAHEKAVRVLQRLQDHETRLMELKRQSEREAATNGGLIVQVDSETISIINDILKVIPRAAFKWDSFLKQAKSLQN